MELGNPGILGEQFAPIVRRNHSPLDIGRVCGALARPGSPEPGPVPSSTVMNQVSICVISRQCLAELLQLPVCCRMICHVMMHDPACPHLYDHEYVQKPECGGDHHKKVTGYNCRCVIPHEGRPTLLRIRPALRPSSVRTGICRPYEERLEARV